MPPPKQPPKRPTPPPAPPKPPAAPKPPGGGAPKPPQGKPPVTQPKPSPTPAGKGGGSKAPQPGVKPGTTPGASKPSGGSKGPQQGPGPKPTTSAGPGRTWKVVGGRWQAVRNTATAPTGPGSTYKPEQPQGQQGQGSDGESGGTTEETVDVPKTKEQIESEAKTQVGYSDPAYQGQFTKLMSDLGFGFGTQGGTGYASFADVFGAPGAGADTSKFVIRDAMGRAITPESYGDILGSDVYSEDAAKNIAGTALGNLITSARRSAAEEAEGRSASGIGGGSGVAGAQAAGRRTAGQMGFGDLLRQLQSGVSEIQSGRGQEYLDALTGIGKEPGSVVKTVPGAASSGQAPPTKDQSKPQAPKAPKKGDKRVSGTGKNKWNQVWNGKKWVSVSRVK